MPGVTCCSDACEAAQGADAVVIATERDAFRALDLERLAGTTAGLLCSPIGR
jgi:UDPglucose 6-dehydrogenase